MYYSSDSDEVLSESSDESSIPSPPYSPLSCVGDGTATLESSSSPAAEIKEMMTMMTMLRRGFCLSVIVITQ